MSARFDFSRFQLAGFLRLSRQAQQHLLAAAIWMVLAIFCATALSHYYGQHKRQATVRDRAGAEAAVAFLARQSLDKIVAGDRISLQLLAQQTLALPAVNGVTIQDVEGNPLAQTGNLQGGETASAPVVLHDSLAGSVTVNLHPGADVEFPWASLILALVFALPVSAAAGLAAGQLLARRPIPVVASRPKPAQEPEPSAGLYLRPVNWAQLGNQLSRAALDSLQAELRQRLEMLARIYAAKPLPGPLPGLGFGGPDAAFRALCCGLLLRELQQASRATGLQLAAAVVPLSAPELNLDGEQLLAQPRGLALHPQLLQDPALTGRIEYHTTGWGAEVTRLTPHYQQLLDNQLQQLVGA